MILKSELVFAVLMSVFGSAIASQGAVVTERWGVGGHVQHPKTLVFEAQKDAVALMRFDLSALPKGTKIHRARLRFTRPSAYGSRFDVVRAVHKGESKDDQVQPAGKSLVLVSPQFRWFDATEAVRTWVEAGSNEGLLLLREAPTFTREATWLEIAYEGDLKSPPKQVTGVKAFCRSGQVFVTFREIENYTSGKEEVTWGELGKRFADISYEGPIPRDQPHEIRYPVYAHDRPISPRTIGQAELLARVAPGSIYNTRLVPGGDFISKRPDAVALRLAIEPGQPLPPGSGLYVHTVHQGGKRYYAVVAAVDGVENTVQLSDANAVGPVDQSAGSPQPVLQDVPKAHGHTGAGITELRDGKKYHEEWYSYWAVPPNAPRPLRYDFAVGYCPHTLARPAPLEFTRGHTWGHTPEMPRPSVREGIVMSMSADSPNGMWTGINDARDTLGGIEDGVWQPQTHNRQETLIRWAAKRWPVDPQRISSGLGAWGMWELRRSDLYSHVHGWGMPEVTKGFQVWNWSRGAWGQPEAYEGKPNDQNPFYLQDYSRFVLENPTRELPYFCIHTGWGAHFSEMGWPPFPRFARAMIDTKRAFTMYCGGGSPVGRAIADGVIVIRRNRSLPALGNCSLDDNLGEGDINSGVSFGQVNGYLLWDTETIVDRSGQWGVTVRLDDSAPLDECTVDLTPRRCQAFRPRPGERFHWTCTFLPPQADDQRQEGASPADELALRLKGGRHLGSGSITADEWHLLTIPRMRALKGAQRVVIQRQ